MEKHRFRSRPENMKSFFAVLCGWGTVLISGFLLFLLSQGVLGVALAHRWILFVGLIAALVMAAAQLLLRPKTSPADAETASAGETLSGLVGKGPYEDSDQRRVDHCFDGVTPTAGFFFHALSRCNFLTRTTHKH